MKKLFLIILYLSFSANSFSQEKYFTKNGEIDFEATMPTFEEIKAKNTTVTSILDINTGEIAVLALMKGFRFKIAMMEEHFNENYVESDKFPNATFKGMIENFNFKELPSEGATFNLKGELTLHGQSKTINTKALVKKDGENLIITTVFKVKNEDFNIKIPSLVSEKIAKEVTVNVNLSLQKK